MLALDYVELLVMLLTLFGGFLAMARYGQSQALVMPILASFFLLMTGTAAPAVVGRSALEFAHVALVFSAVAIPAHQIERSGLFAWIGARLGARIGRLSLRAPKLRTFGFVAVTLASVWISAAALHNITAVLIWTPITITICASFGLPSRWLLCGVLVASNLGGFSTAWGDTPNLIESRVWNLTNVDFLREILPINAFMIAGLVAAVTWLTQRQIVKTGTVDDLHQARETANFRFEAGETFLDRRRLAVGLIALLGFIALQFFRRDLETAVAAGAILFALLAERDEDRLRAMHALGIDVYATLAAVFVIADCIAHAALGGLLHQLIESTHGAVWAVAISSYVGTGLTEAASWASAAAPLTHQANPGHAGAWALGAGICAGSSSVLTAASAGIVLWSESGRFPGHQVTFRSYFPFGVLGSLAMLAAFVLVLSILQSIGALS